tara:strand:- start:1099 stop:1320 length:222 start_codon:yes stop_codon:yes gene_type:complete
MEQPDYLILNPVFNSFPYNRKYHKYVHIETPYIKKDNTIIWNKIVVLQPGKLFIKMKDISNYKEYMLEKIGIN